MKKHLRPISSTVARSLDGRLAAYMAAVGAGATLASSAEGAVVANTTLQPFGVNQEVNIDFNMDGQTDYQIDHDRVDLGSGNVVDYLQLDKNDVSSETNPLPINDAATFPTNSTTANDTAQAGYLIPGSTIGSYPAALVAGTPIGPGLGTFEFQEGTNFNSTGRTIRANRLIDEDQTQVDQVLGGKTPAQVQVPFNGPNFLGLNGDVRYLGVKMELNNSGLTNYGWIGVRIDNEADATGAVVGYGYETLPNVPILAGQVPEPGSLFMAATGSLALLGAAMRRRLKQRRLS
jgi:hypothetical protein